MCGVCTTHRGLEPNINHSIPDLLRDRVLLGSQTYFIPDLDKMAMFVFLWKRQPQCYSSPNIEFANKNKIPLKTSGWEPNCLPTKVFLNRGTVVRRIFLNKIPSTAKNFSIWGNIRFSRKDRDTVNNEFYRQL